LLGKQRSRGLWFQATLSIKGDTISKNKQTKQQKLTHKGLVEWLKCLPSKCNILSSTPTIVRIKEKSENNF
jgi:hypothetical protein